MTTVLILDDDKDILHLLCDVLAEAGIHGVPMTESHQMDAAIHALQASACLIDLMLHDGSGLEVAEDLRHSHATLPLIALSASPFLAEVARETGLFVAVLDKPFDVDGLLLALAEVIAASSTQPA